MTTIASVRDSSAAAAATCANFAKNKKQACLQTHTNTHAHRVLSQWHHSNNGSFSQSVGWQEADGMKPT